MKQVSQAWQEIQNLPFINGTNIIIDITKGEEYSMLLGKDQVMSLNIMSSGDVMSGMITQQSLTFTAYDPIGRLNYDDEYSSDYFYGAEIKPTYAFTGGGSISGECEYYVTSSKKEGKNKYTFRASSIMAFMTERLKDSEYYTLGTVSTAQYIIFAIQDQINSSNYIPHEHNYTIECDFEVLSGINFQILETDMFSLSEILQMIAHAYGCVVRCSSGHKILIQKVQNHAENYVLSEKVAYKEVVTSYSSAISNIEFRYNHDTMFAESGYDDDTGGIQQMSNPIVAGQQDSQLIPALIANNCYKMMRNKRKMMKCNYRYDPRIELFDMITVANGKRADVSCVMKINATYNGGWKAEVDTICIPEVSAGLRIMDLEKLTIEQLESLKINQMSSDTETE